MKIVLKPVKGRIVGSYLGETTPETVDIDMERVVHFMQKNYNVHVVKTAPYTFDVSRMNGSGDYIFIGIICLED